MKKLLNQEKLLSSGVVANTLMNRERGCLGGNSYQKELSFDPIEFLRTKLERQKFVSWLDICCGEGRALIGAAAVLDANLAGNLQITGIDLVGMFRRFPSKLKHLKLVETSAEDFEPLSKFDLITCVHGLHYVGDKLALIQKAGGWLKEAGVFLANLDLNNLKLAGQNNASRVFSNFLQKQGFRFDTGKHLLNLKGQTSFDLPFEYAGADDKAGPNYTGQSAVNSYYKFQE